MERIGYLVVVLVAHVVVANSEACPARIRSCASTGAMKITSVTAPECCNQNGLCVLKKGTNVTVTMAYKTDEDFQSLQQNLCGNFQVFGVTSCLTMPSLSNNFCQFTPCPIHKNEPSVAKFAFPISNFYPTVQLAGKWTFTNPRTSKVVGCFEIIIKIAS